MKKLYSTLIAMLAVVVFAGVAHTDPGTTWEKKISISRFVVLKDLDGAAVFDKETGRVWEQSPSTATFVWDNALPHCYTLEIGGRKGWRLPTIEELASLVDTSQSNPALPAGNPFSNVQSAGSLYSSATTDTVFSSFAWKVGFATGGVVVNGKDVANFVWCVRGGQGIDGVQ